MKTTLLLTTLLATLSMGLTQAQTATPQINQTQANQAARINQGVATGELNKKEAARLRADQRKIQAEKKIAKADGKVTKAERAAIKSDQAKASKRIYKQKHDANKAK
jgi:hypothetical protein